MTKRETVLVAGTKTVAESFNAIKALLTDESMIAFIDDRIAKATTKSGSKKETDRQVENRQLGEIIKAYLVENGEKSISELIAEIPELSGLTTQRVAPIVNKIENITFVMDKKVKRFKVEEGEVVAE